MNYFTNPYLPQQPIMPTMPQPPVMPNNTNYVNGGNLYFVGSLEEANKWIVNPNQTVYLLDRNNAKFYIKSVEKNGMATPLQVFNLSQENIETNEEIKTEYATKEDLFNLKEQFSEEIRKVKENEEQYVSTTTTDTTDTTESESD